MFQFRFTPSTIQWQMVLRWMEEKSKRCRYLSIFHFESASRKYCIHFRKCQRIRIGCSGMWDFWQLPLFASLDDNVSRLANFEWEGLLFVKHGIRPYSPCCFCMVQMVVFSRNKYVTNRSPVHCLNALLDRRNGFVIAQQKGSKLVIVPIIPVLHDILLVDIHEVGDIYAIFCYEPLHFLSLGVSKLLKECLFNRLSDPHKSSKSITFSFWKQKMFPMIKKLVFGQLNWILKHL